MYTFEFRLGTFSGKCYHFPYSLRVDSLLGSRVRAAEPRKQAAKPPLVCETQENLCASLGECEAEHEVLFRRTCLRARLKERARIMRANRGSLCVMRAPPSLFSAYPSSSLAPPSHTRNHQNWRNDQVGTQLLTTSNFIGPSYHAALLFSGLRSIVLLSFCCRSIVFSANQRRRS